MSTVTVLGAHSQIFTLTYDTAANAALARLLAAAITAGVKDGTLLPAVDTDGPPPTLPSGAAGQFVQTNNGATFLTPGYRAFVDIAPQSVIFGSGDADKSVLSSIGSLNFAAAGGSGTVVAGGGNNRVFIPGGDNGDWSVNTGMGDNSVLAFGGGNNTVFAGGGNNAILLGNGNSVVQSTGDDTVSASGGQATITAVGNTSDLIFGGPQLFYVGTQGGSATVFGGSGSDTFLGGSGPDVAHGGTAGDNLLFAGTGHATLVWRRRRRSAVRFWSRRPGTARWRRQRDAQWCVRLRRRYVLRQYRQHHDHRRERARPLRIHQRSVQAAPT